MTKEIMQPFIIRHSKQILLGILFSVMFLIVAEMLPRVFERYLPFEHYVKIDAVTVNDVVVGDKYQSGTIIREVKVGEGYPIDVVTELMLVGVTDNGDSKIFYTTQHQFLEKSDQTNLTFREPIPSDLPVGTYYWIYGFTLNVNNNIYKSKAIKSNSFEVRRITDFIKDNEIIEGVEVNEDKANESNVNLENPNVTSTTTDSDIKN